MKKHIPNIITLLNLLCGCACIVAVLNSQYDYVFILLFIALWADFGDGFVARLLKTHSSLGKELDSLADMVTFGLLPGAMMYQLLLMAQGVEQATLGQHFMLAFPGFLITAFSCLRLAKFNIDTRQSDSFIGLATPSGTIFIAGFLLMAHDDSFGLRTFILQLPLLYFITILTSYLLVAEIPMMSFKFKSFSWKGNEIRFIYIAVTIVMLFTLKYAAILLAILFYIAIALFQLFFSSPKKEIS